MILGDTVAAGPAPDTAVRPLYDQHYGIRALPTQ
jgi:hypothetical protein